MNPCPIPVVIVHDFAKFSIPPPLSFELKTMSRNVPPKGQRNQSISLFFKHIALVGPGSYPRGKPMNKPESWAGLRPGGGTPLYKPYRYVPSQRV